jgi:hypothetical protein
MNPRQTGRSGNVHPLASYTFLLWAAGRISTPPSETLV